MGFDNLWELVCVWLSVCACVCMNLTRNRGHSLWRHSVQEVQVGPPFPLAQFHLFLLCHPPDPCRLCHPENVHIKTWQKVSSKSCKISQLLYHLLSSYTNQNMLFFMSPWLHQVQLDQLLPPGLALPVFTHIQRLKWTAWLVKDANYLIA